MLCVVRKIKNEKLNSFCSATYGNTCHKFMMQSVLLWTLFADTSDQKFTNFCASGCGYWFFLWHNCSCFCCCHQVNFRLHELKVYQFVEYLVLHWINLKVLWLFCRWISKDGIGAVGRLFIGLAIIKGAKEKKKFCAEYFYLLFLSLQVGALGIFLMMIQNSGACMQTSLAALEGLSNKLVA